MSKTIRLFVIAALVLLSNFASAQTVYKLEGKIGGRYPVVIELKNSGDGLYSGRYAYKSTLQRSGDKPCSWLSISPSSGNPSSIWVVRDCDSKAVETWYDVRVSPDGSRFTCRLKNLKGVYYDLVATASGRAADNSHYMQREVLPLRGRL